MFLSMEDSSTKVQTDRKPVNSRTFKGRGTAANTSTGSSIIADGLMLGGKIPLISHSTVSVSYKPEAKLPKRESSKVHRLEKNVIPAKLPVPHVQNTTAIL